MKSQRDLTFNPYGHFYAILALALVTMPDDGLIEKSLQRLRKGRRGSRSRNPRNSNMQNMTVSGKVEKKKKTKKKGAHDIGEKTLSVAETTINACGSDKEFDKRIAVSFVQHVLDKGPKGLREEFGSMKRTNNFEIMKAFVAANEKGLNRYKDVGCLDNCRVMLKPPFPHDYIHGNYVSTQNNPNKFICTQAPLEKTCLDFWYMCLTNKVEVIMMMCNLEEKGAKKCYKYYPDAGESLTFGSEPLKITVRCAQMNKLDFGDNLRESLLSVDGCGMSMRTRHLHWVDWPDRGVPPADMTIIKLLDRYRKSLTPIVVHCSAGIGRTGCVVMLEYYYEQIQSNKNMSLGPDVLKSIRAQRNNSIQTEHQYLFVNMVLLNYLDKKGLFDKASHEALQRFTEDYKKCLI